MSETPINLNRARKARARDEQRRTADANAVKFGRTKAERELEQARKDQTLHRLDAHRRRDDETE